MRRAQRITVLFAELGCTPAERVVIYTLAHLSDLHATPVEPGGPAPLLGKRFFGWLSWRLRRHREHQPAVLEALLADLRETAPDQIAITGDLTNVSLESEFPAARRWLERIGPPERVMAIPGNHDAYVKVPHERGWDLWRPWLDPDPEWRGAANAATGFPSVRVRGPLALIGLCSAQPTPLFMAGGSLGSDQLARLDALLRELRERGLVRVLLVHHAAVPGTVSSRRALWDAPALAALLARRGAELVLHGHLHRTRFEALDGPDGPIPVVCTRSASDRGERPERRAQYHLLDVDAAGGKARFTLRVRGYEPESGRFRAEGDPRPL